MSDDVVGPYAELRGIQRRLSWLESRLAELAETVERARAAVDVGLQPEPPAEPAPDVILSAADVVRIAEAHRRLWEGEEWCTRCSGTMPCDANLLAASHERLRALADAAGRDAVALRSVLRELPGAVRALARVCYLPQAVRWNPDVPLPGVMEVMDWGEAMRWCVEAVVKRDLAARGLRV